ncbi:MAG: sugar phosphate isomerase/epimerase [Candidatus Coatesbacteria bacterium]
MRLCVTSVMLPRWTLDETFDRLREAGFDGLELRVRPDAGKPGEAPSFWGRHVADVSPANVLEKAPAIRAAAARTGITVVALAPWVTAADAEATDILFRGAVAIDPKNPPMIRVGVAGYDRAKPYLPQFDAARDAFAGAVKRAKPFGVKCIYEIHAGTLAMSATRASALLAGLDPRHAGAIYDIPNMSRVGLEDTRQGMEALGPYLAHCHIGGSRPVVKPGERDEWSWEFCDLRRGIANIPAILDDFRHVGYGGWLSLEDFSPGDDGVKIREQGAWLKSLGVGS